MTLLRKEYFSCWIALSILLMCCVENGYKENINNEVLPDVINIWDSGSQLLNSKELIQDVTLIPVNYGSESDFLLSGIDKIIPYGNYFYILDREFSSVFKLDSNGLVKSKIGELGVKHSQYGSLQDFDVDGRGRIVLLSNTSKSLFYYSSNGTFLKRQPIGFFNYYLGIRGIAGI